MDFIAPVVYEVENQSGIKKEYTVHVNSFNGLPIVQIETQDRYVNPDKNIYVNGNMKIFGTTKFPRDFEATMKLKGRGNATWASYPKKPYRIKFDTGASVLGMPFDKDWVLLAQYCDKSLMRVSLLYEASRIMQMDWTQRMEYVDVILNGRYEGTYLLGEHIETSATKVNVDNDGFLIENSGNYYASEPIWFQSFTGAHFTFKTPDPDIITQQQINEIKADIDEFESVLYGDNYADPETGYRKYIDVKSFVDWFICNNVMDNEDTNFYYKKINKSSKIAMGPVADAEWSLGLGWDWTSPAPVTRWLMHPYFNRLTKDKYFVDQIKIRWNEKKVDLDKGMFEFIQNTYAQLLYSQESNFVRWNILGSYIGVGGVALTTYNNEVKYVQDFLRKRIDWLDVKINSL